MYIIRLHYAKEIITTNTLLNAEIINIRECL